MGVRENKKFLSMAPCVFLPIAPMNYLITEMWPRMHAAWSGVLERSSRALTTTPAAKRVRTISSFPGRVVIVVVYVGYDGGRTSDCCGTGYSLLC